MSFYGVHEHRAGRMPAADQERQPTAVVRHLLLRPDGLYAIRSVAPAPPGTDVSPLTVAMESSP